MILVIEILIEIYFLVDPDLKAAASVVLKSPLILDRTTTRFFDSDNTGRMKATQSLFKRISRLPLTTKQTNKGFYKGTGSGSMGEHTKHGGYIIDWDKVRTYVVPPNLKDFKVR